MESNRLARTIAAADDLDNPVIQGLVEEVERLRSLLDRAHGIVAYVSLGRKYVDVTPYPDAYARRVNAEILEAKGVR